MRSRINELIKWSKTSVEKEEKEDQFVILIGRARVRTPFIYFTANTNNLLGISVSYWVLLTLQPGLAETSSLHRLFETIRPNQTFAGSSQEVPPFVFLSGRVERQRGPRLLGRPARLRADRGQAEA